MPDVPGICQYSPSKYLAEIHDRFSINIMDMWQILCTLRDVNSFLDIFPSDFFPSSRTVLKPCTLIVNADPHKEGDSHWLSTHLTHRSSSAYYFDSYGIVPLVQSIQAFQKRHCTTWEYNKRQLQGLTSEFCGHYCCLLALYMDRSYTHIYSSRSSLTPDLFKHKHWCTMPCHKFPKFA